MTMLRAAGLVGILIVTPALASAQQPCTSDANQVVDAIYQQVLERAPDAGAQGWVRRLGNREVTVRDLVREIAKSNEHVQRFLSTPNREQTVTYLYQHVLGRAPDPGGMSTYLNIVSSRGAAGAVDSLLSSGEYQRYVSDNGVRGTKVRYCSAGEAPVATTGSTGSIRFRGMDTNNDGRISREEWRGSDQSFNVHDWNNDGALSGDEVRQGGRRARVDDEDFSPNNNRFLNWSEAGFRGLDDNRDGVISSREWHYDTESFYRADRNRDGILSRQEFLSTDMDDDRDDRFSYLDANRNGRVDRNEWHGSDTAFDWLDRNRDGVLNRAEVAGENARARDEFAGLDIDDDRRIERGEWHWSRRSFDQRDANGDGFLTQREFESGGAVPTTGR
jgi:Ca2+-binding EF-hand superfamily protein